jgi:predicted transcriptional regulator
VGEMMKEISISNVLQEISGNVFLVTRPLGMKMRDKIIELILQSDSIIVALDFEGVKIIDYSGADEVIVRLTTRLVNKELGERFIFLKNLEPIHRENIQAAFQLNKKHGMFELRSDDLLSMIGNIKPMLIDVLQKVYNEHIRTARQIADLAKTEINLAGTKLLQLYQERLIMRKEETLLEGGRQYTYWPIINKSIIWEID